MCRDELHFKLFLCFIAAQVLDSRNCFDPYRDPHAEMSQTNKDHRTVSCPVILRFLRAILGFVGHTTCSMTSPMVIAAVSCACRVACV